MYPVFPGVTAWTVANVPSPAQRAVTIAYLLCAGNAGGVVGSYIYKEDEAPRYPTGFGTSFAFAAAGVVAALVLEFLLWTGNKRNAGVVETESGIGSADGRLARSQAQMKYAL